MSDKPDMEQQQLDEQDPEATLAAAIRFCRIVYERQGHLERQLVALTEKFEAVDAVARQQQRTLQEALTMLKATAAALTKGRPRGVN
jgi:hypothetical protein